MADRRGVGITVLLTRHEVLSTVWRYVIRVRNTCVIRNLIKVVAKLQVSPGTRGTDVARSADEQSVRKVVEGVPTRQSVLQE